LFALFRDENRKKPTDFTLCVLVFYGCKTREISRDWHNFQLPRGNQLRNPNELHVENSVVLLTVKKLPAFVVKLENITVISDDLV